MSMFLRGVLSILFVTALSISRLSAGELTGTTLADAGKAVTRLLVSPDGKTLAGMDATGAVRLWDLTNGKSRGSLPGTGSAAGMDFSPDGKLLALCGPKTIKLFDVVTRLPDSEIPHGFLAAREIAFSPENGLLAVTGVAGHGHSPGGWAGEAYYPASTYEKFAIGVWDWKNNDLQTKVECNDVAIAFNRTGTELYARYKFRGDLYSLDVRNELKNRHSTPPPGDGPGDVHCHPRELVQPGSVMLMATTNRITGWALDRQGKPVEAVKFNVPGTVHRVRFAVAAGLDRMVIVHEPLDAQTTSPFLKVHDRDGSEFKVVAEKRRPHGTSRVIGLILTPDGKSAITAAEDGSVIQWTLPAPK